MNSLECVVERCQRNAQKRGKVNPLDAELIDKFNADPHSAYAGSIWERIDQNYQAYLEHGSFLGAAKSIGVDASKISSDVKAWKRLRYWIP